MAAHSGDRQQARTFTTSPAAGGSSERVAVLPMGGGAIVVTASLQPIRDTLRQILIVELGVGLGVLVLTGGLGLALARQATRPLEEIAVTADAIAAGDMDRRVPTGRSGSETGRVARALNAMLTQIQDAFNGLGQLITEYQSHSGAVNTGTTPKVQYSYTLMSGGVNNSRLTGITYSNAANPTPNVGFAYDPYFPRLASMTDGTGTTQYSYVPVGALGALHFPQQRVHFRHRQVPLSAHGRVARHRSQQMVDRLFDAPRLAGFHKIRQHIAHHAGRVACRQQAGNSAQCELIGRQPRHHEP